LHIITSRWQIRFPFDEKFRFEFPEISSDEWKSISGISGKEDNLARNTEIFGNFLPGISVPFYSPPGISGIFG